MTEPYGETFEVVYEDGTKVGVTWPTLEEFAAQEALVDSIIDRLKELGMTEVGE